MKVPMHRHALQQLEEMIDSHGLAEVIDAIGDICVEKSFHIRQNWQDEDLARQWDAAGRAMFRANCDERVQRVSR